MNNKIKDVPKLRFPGFEEEWKIDNIGAHVDIISGVPIKGEDISENPSGTPILRGVNITEGYIRHSRDIDRFYMKSIDAIDKFIVQEGDLVIPMDGSKVGRNYAIVSKSEENAVLIQRVARLRSKSMSCLPFIYQHISSAEFQKYVDEVNTSSGIPHISLKQLQQFKVAFPTLLEQQKIAAFLTAVDDKIQQLSKKKALLEQYKKGVMHQIFNREIRFKDENGKDYPKWEEKRLSEICDVKGGKRLPKGYSLIAESNDFPYITVSDMENGTIRTDSIKFVPMEATHIIKNYKITVDDIYISVAGTLGLVGIVPQELNNANLTENANKLTNLRCNQRYLYHYLTTADFARLIQGVRTSNAQPKLAIYALNGFDINLPCIEEQTKIADFLSAIDNKIKHVDGQLELTKQYKKGLLQQMFV
jgi:type I restriction enzyme S subunit